MANTYNYNGEMLRPSAILKHYPNISIATIRNWLRACDAISDVKEQLDTRYQKLYATGIKSKAEQLYVYNGKLSFTRSIAEEIGVATPTVYEWLKTYKAYTDITQVITAKLWCRDADILYHGEQTKAYRVLSGIDADVVDFYNIVSHLTGDTSEAIDSNFDTIGTVFTFRGKVLNRRGIAYYLGVTESIVWNRTKGISRAEAEAVLRQFDKNTLRAVKTYIYHNRELDISTISETVGSKRTLVCQWLHGIPAGEDVSELLDAHIWCRDTTILYHGKATNAYCVLRILNTDVVRFYRVVHSLEGDVSRTVDLAFSTTGKVYAFRDMVLNCAGIAYYLESHVSVIDRRLKGLSREDAEAVLREMDKHARRKPISYNYQGESLSASAISQRLGLSAQTLPRIIRTYEFTEENVYEFLQYITDRVAPASTNVIDAVNQTKMGSLLKLYDGTFMLPETAYKLFRVTNVNLNTIGVLNTLWCAHKQGAEIHHIFDSLYEFTCPECGRKLLLTSDEIFSFKHSNEFCVGKEII